MSASALLPGATLGVVGGGQLGRMFALAAARLGYRVHVLAPEADPPAAQVAAAHTRAAYDDGRAVERFAAAVGAVTYEFENIPPQTLRAIAACRPVRPSPEILEIARHRRKEKTFLRDRGIPVTPFLPAAKPADLPAAARALGGVAVLKTSEWGYDGKGQTVFRADDDPEAAWAALGRPDECIVERRIELAGEFSVIVARDAAGGVVFYGPFHNEHRNHILDVTVWEAEPKEAAARPAREIGGAVADAFGLVGLICVECFVAANGEIMVNEIAPRPHNSGHLTIEACSIGQFEQQARVTAGLAAVPPVPRAPAAAMANLLGDLWAGGEPDWSAVLNDPAIALHLYGKREARPGRKMGHLTALADTRAAARARVVAARQGLMRGGARAAAVS